MGREWVNKKRVDYVVLLPVLIRTLRKNGTTDDYYGFFPVSSLPQDIDREILRATETDQGKAEVKQRVLQLMQRKGIGDWISEV